MGDNCTAKIKVAALHGLALMLAASPERLGEIGKAERKNGNGGAEQRSLMQPRAASRSLVLRSVHRTYIPCIVLLLPISPAMSPWLDGVPYVATYRALLNAQLERLLDNYSASSLSQPVPESDCQQLLTQLRELKDQWPQQGSGPDARAPIEAVARDIFASLSAQTDLSHTDGAHLWLLLDVLNMLSDNQLCEPALAFWLVEELLDSQTIEGCKRVFDYLESRRQVMTAHFFREKSLVILRSCNELLRRLSRAEDTVFCGRVFIFLFQSFPLGDKSSVNLRGEFHVENVTDYDPAPSKSEHAIQPMDLGSHTPEHATQPTDLGSHTPAKAVSAASTPLDSDAAPASSASVKAGHGTPLPRQAQAEKAEPPPDLDALYPKFWALQSLFSSPTRLFDPTAMAQLKEGMALTLSCFRSMSNSSSSSAANNALPGSRKRKASDLDPAIAAAATTTPATSVSSTPFNPKYLTNRDLFDLEVHDLAFRRHVLVQSLIMLDFLLSLSPSAKAKASSAPGLTNKSVLYAHTLSEDDTKWCIQTRAAMASYLQQQGSGNEGKMYYRMVDTVLSRDKNWVRWKAESCPPITRASVEVESYLKAQSKLERIASDATRPLLNPPGASEFDFLLKPTTTESLKQPRQKGRYKIPTLQNFYDHIQREDLDMDFATTEREKKDIEERKMANVWRALRASVETGERVKLADALGEQGTNYAALVPNTTAEEEADEGTSSVKAEEEQPAAENGHDGQAEAEPATAPVPATDTH
ncbi:hypothetical protein DV735_g772, partial [Chaetothyriales sp. CBS 134920]